MSNMVHSYIFSLIDYFKVTVSEKEIISVDTIARTRRQLAEQFADFIERYIMGDVVAVSNDNTGGSISAVDLVTHAFISAAKTEPEWFDTKYFDYWLSNLGILAEKQAVKVFFLTVWRQ